MGFFSLNETNDIRLECHDYYDLKNVYYNGIRYWRLDDVNDK